MKPLRRLVAAALKEDIGVEDITTNRTVPEDLRCRARLVAKQDGVLSGIEPFCLSFEIVEADVDEWESLSDGDRFDKGEVVASFQGLTRAVLTAERVAMNFVQHLSGVATLTSRFVAAIDGLNVRICDTRKTTPLLRELEKKAVVHGGGSNHRHNLFNGILVKENHITAAGGIAEAMKRVSAGAHHLMRVEIEARNLDEFQQAMAAGADAILLDNMDLGDMKRAVEIARGSKVLLEASGNASLENVRALAETGVDLISVGALTHSAPVVDLSLLIENM